jgi:hypothetical protein
MNPIHAERGKFYYAIKCQNAQCQEPLPLIEAPIHLSFDEKKNLEKQVAGRVVRCPICTRETPIEQRRLYILGVS